MTRVFLLTWVLLSVTIVSSVCSASRRRDATGQEWLSWNPAERSAFTIGFIDGYLRGTRKACDAANDLFEVGKGHRLGEDPSARCQSRIESYSKDADAYIAVLTDFYTKYPAYRNIPFIYLFFFLSDNQFKTADQLYKMALKGEMRTNF